MNTISWCCAIYFLNNLFLQQKKETNSAYKNNKYIGRNIRSKLGHTRAKHRNEKKQNVKIDTISNEL